MILVLIATFFGCKKEGESLPYTEVYGKVVSTGSQQPIDSVRVSIWDGFGTTTQSNYDTTYTDKNGNFHIGVRGNEPVLFLHKKGYEFNYSYSGAALGVAPLIAGKKYDYEKFNLDGIAYFNPVFMNKIPMLSSDSLIISVPPHIVIDYLGNGPHRYRFSDPNGVNLLGDSYSKYKLDYQVNGKWYTKIDSVYLKALQYYKDTIYY